MAERVKHQVNAEGLILCHGNCGRWLPESDYTGYRKDGKYEYRVWICDEERLERIRLAGRKHREGKKIIKCQGEGCEELLSFNGLCSKCLAKQDEYERTCTEHICIECGEMRPREMFKGTYQNLGAEKKTRWKCAICVSRYRAEHEIKHPCTICGKLIRRKDSKCIDCRRNDECLPSVSLAEKVCMGCGKSKPIREFYNGDKKNIFGNPRLCSKCHECRNMEKREIRYKKYSQEFSKYRSQEEIDVYTFVVSLLGADRVQHSRRCIIPPLELDIYIPDLNIAIEYDGLYWHSEPNRDKQYHLTKTLMCDEKGIQLIHIFSDEWLTKRSVVESMLRSRFGLITDRKAARKLEVKEFEHNSQDIVDFFNTNHLAGHVKFLKCYALVDESGQIYSAVSFRNPFHKKYRGFFEISRFASKKDTNIPGGFSKLLKYACYDLKNICTGILTYADLRFGKGFVYEKSGFEFVDDTVPDYFYTDGDKRFSRFKFRAQDGKTEKEIAMENKVSKIYGCGSRLYMMEFGFGGCVEDEEGEATESDESNAQQETT